VKLSTKIVIKKSQPEGMPANPDITFVKAGASLNARPNIHKSQPENVTHET